MSVGIVLPRFSAQPLRKPILFSSSQTGREREGREFSSSGGSRRGCGGIYVCVEGLRESVQVQSCVNFETKTEPCVKFFFFPVMIVICSGASESGGKEKGHQCCRMLPRPAGACRGVGSQNCPWMLSCRRKKIYIKKTLCRSSDCGG